MAQLKTAGGRTTIGTDCRNGWRENSRRSEKSPGDAGPSNLEPDICPKTLSLVITLVIRKSLGTPEQHREFQPPKIQVALSFELSIAHSLRIWRCGWPLFTRSDPLCQHSERDGVADISSLWTTEIVDLFACKPSDM
jgi:hypothetical protein